MKATVLGVLALTALAGTAQAQLAPTTDLGVRYINRDGTLLAQQGSQPGVRAVVNTYRNWDGASVLNGTLTTGQNRLDGDDISLVPNGGNWLDNMGFSIANRNTPAGANLTAMRVTFDFFDAGTLLPVGGFFSDLNLVAIFGANGLPANNSARLAFGAGALAALNLSLPNNFLITQTFSNVVGVGNADPNLVGLQVRNPVVIGASADSLVLNGSVTASPFGGNPLGNFSYFFDTNSVPAPGAAALLGLGGILAARRRR